MRNYPFVLIVLIFLSFSGCKKATQESDKLFLNISSTEWHTDTFAINNNHFRGIYLKISGSSNAGLISIQTTGDGTAGCSELKRATNTNFNSDVLIRFFPIHDTIKKKASTVITAFSSRTPPNMPVYCEATGSGDTISRELESQFFPSK
jgi:hypothetical protein